MSEPLLTLSGAIRRFGRQMPRLPRIGHVRRFEQEAVCSSCGHTLNV